MSFKLPFGVEVLNPVPTDTRRGPYTAANETDAKALACTGVPLGIRGQGQQVDLIIDGKSSVYVWADGTSDSDLVPLETPLTSEAITTALNLTNTDALTEGSSNLYFTAAKVLSTLLTGIGFSTSTAVAATDSIRGAIGKLQVQINNFVTNLTTSVTGILNVGNGGTGSTSFISGNLLFGNGTNALGNDNALFWDNTTKRLAIGANYSLLNPLSTLNFQYSVGVASQTLDSINGVGTSWTSVMIGQTLIFANGVNAGFITGIVSPTQLKVSISQTVSIQAYNIIYPALQVSQTNNVGIGQLYPATWLSNTNSAPFDNEGMTTSQMGITWCVNTNDLDRFAMSLENYGSYGNGLLIKKSTSGHYALKAVNQSNGLEFYVGDGGKIYTSSTIQSVGSWTMGADIGIFPISGQESMVTAYHGLMLIGKKGSVSPVPSIGNLSNVAIPIQDGSAIGFLIKSAMTQTGNFLEIQNNAGTTMARIDSNATAIFPQYRLSSLNTAPGSSTDIGTAGEIRFTSNYIYVCIATDTWVRASLLTW